MNKLVIIGSGGHGKVIADIAEKNGYTDILFLDDNPNATACGSYAVVGCCKDAARYFGADFIVAIGNAKVRRKLQTELTEQGLRVVSLIHPAAVIASNVTIGTGTVVMAGAVVNPYAEIGEGCIINTCASVDHDCRIGDFVHVSVGAHLAGTVTVGDSTWIGAGATVSNNIKIIANCMVGAGAVVMNSLDEVGTYVGVPAKQIMKRQKVMKKICFVTTVSITIKSFLIELSKYLVENGDYDVTFICNTDESMYQYCTDRIHYIPVAMTRGVSFDGLKVIKQLKKIFQAEQFDIIQYSTPNASLYASIAAKQAGCENRLYCQWGIRYMGFEKGIKRAIFKFLEKKVCKNSTVIECESNSLYRFSVEEKLYPAQKASVVLHGSACGVNLDRYDLSQRETWRKELRARYGISDSTCVFGYVGRITQDKGINELLEAFRKVLQTSDDVRLMLIGTIDDSGSMNPELLNWAQSSPNVIFVDWTDKIQQYYCALDVFASLSYREGFGLVVIEAAAMELPAIVTNVPGQKDTITDGEEGVLVTVKNVDDVVSAMQFYIQNPEKRCVMGKKARKSVEEKYEQTKLFQALAHNRDLLIQK